LQEYNLLYKYIKEVNLGLDDKELLNWYYNSFCAAYENLAKLYEHTVIITPNGSRLRKENV